MLRRFIILRKEKYIMKRKILCVILSVITFTLSLCSNISISAETEISDPLYAYKQRLIVLNDMYNTSLGIPDTTATGGDYSEIVAIFSSMTINEFDEYIKSIIDGSIYDSDDETIKVNKNNDESIMPLSYLQEQRYYYKLGSNNYLYAKAYVQYADGYNRYTSLYSTGHGITSYPALKVNYSSASFSNNYRDMNVTYNVTNYLTATVYDTANRTVSVTFSSSGGNVYGSINL